MADKDQKKIAIKETADWMERQVEHVWRALGVGGERADRELRTNGRGPETEYLFMYRGKILAKARSYFSRHERQWKFELTEADQERYEAVKEYFAGLRTVGDL